MKKALKRISFIGSITSICTGGLLLLKGMQGSGILGLIIAGIVLIFSGILNIVMVSAGLLDGLELLFRKIANSFK